MLRLAEDRLPALAAIGGKKHTTPCVHVGSLLSPCGKIHPSIVPGVQRQPGRAVDALRQRHLRPVFRSIDGLVQSAASPAQAIASVVGAGHDQIKRAVIAAYDSPGKVACFGDAAIFQLPCSSVVRRFIYAQAESAGVQGALPNRACRIEQHVRECRCFHADV